jgi:Flp pilus assembly protein TadD
MPELRKSKPVKSLRRRPAARKRRPIPMSIVAAKPVSEEAFYVVDSSEVQNDFDQPLSTDFFNTLGRIKALPAKADSVALAKNSSASHRGYESADLDVIAQMATNYLLNGGTRLAVTLFEGLVAVAPEVPYYAMGLGLTYDHLGDLRKAEACYRAAGRLSPKDGRPDVNLAELALAAGDKKRAFVLFQRGERKATKMGDLSLARKALALMSHVQNQ